MRKIPLLSQSFRKGDAPQINEEGKFRVKEHVQGDWPSHVYIDGMIECLLLEILLFSASPGVAVTNPESNSGIRSVQRPEMYGNG